MTGADVGGCSNSDRSATHRGSLQPALGICHRGPSETAPLKLEEKPCSGRNSELLGVVITYAFPKTL